MTREHIIILAIVLCSISLTIIVELIYILLRTNYSKKKFTFKRVKVENEFYMLYPMKNKGVNFVELYSDSTMLPEKKEDSVVVDKAIEEDKKSYKRINEVRKVEDNKSHMVLHYFNIKDPCLNVLYYENSTLVKQKRYLLNDYRIDKGIIVNINDLAKIIKQDFNVSVKVDLKLSINESFKYSVSLPKISKGKAIKLSNTELKREFPNIKHKYYLISNQYNHKLGYVFDTYFIPTEIIDCFKKLCYLMGCKLSTYDLYGNYIYNIITSNYAGSYSYIHTKDNMGLFINVNNNKLTTIYDFSFNNYNELLNKYLLVISKHEFEYEKETINTLFTDSDYSLELANDINIEVNKYNINFDYYITGGKKL